MNPGIAPYLFFAGYLVALTGVALGTHHADRHLPLTDRGRRTIVVGCVALGAVVPLMVRIVSPLLPSVVMAPGRITPFAVWTAGILNGVVVMWALWAWRRRPSQAGTQQGFVNLLAVAACVWVVGLVGFLLLPYRYAVSWYLAGVARPFGVGVIFVALLREQVWLYSEARARVNDLEQLHEAGQALMTTLVHDAALQGYGRRLLAAATESDILDDAVDTTRRLLDADRVALFPNRLGRSSTARGRAVGWGTKLADTDAALAFLAESGLNLKETLEIEDRRAGPTRRRRG